MAGVMAREAVTRALSPRSHADRSPRTHAVAPRNEAPSANGEVEDVEAEAKSKLAEVAVHALDKSAVVTESFIEAGGNKVMAWMGASSTLPLSTTASPPTIPPSNSDGAQSSAFLTPSSDANSSWTPSLDGTDHSNSWASTVWPHPPQTWDARSWDARSWDARTWDASSWSYWAPQEERVPSHDFRQQVVELQAELASVREENRIRKEQPQFLMSGTTQTTASRRLLCRHSILWCRRNQNRRKDAAHVSLDHH